MKTLGVATIIVLGLCAAVAAAALSPSPSGQDPAGAKKPPAVLFMCPHGAAKSVLASAYFQRLAKERGLNVRVESAGTEPDPEVAPAVAKHLVTNGYIVPTAKPRRVTDTDMATADVVVSIGCDMNGVPAAKGRLIRWDDVPAPSEDFARADEKIRQHVAQLLDELVRQQQR